MRVVCAWCERLLADGPGPVSHGICEGCAFVFERAHLRTLAERERKQRRRTGQRAGAPLPGFEAALSEPGEVCAARR